MKEVSTSKYLQITRQMTQTADLVLKLSYNHDNINNQPNIHKLKQLNTDRSSHMYQSDDLPMRTARL